MIQKIKDIAFAVVDAYSKGVPLNDSILAVADSIDNEEILKRVCELANNNVYLSIFHTPSVDRSNIVFDVADFDKINSEIKRRKFEMNDYSTGPSAIKYNVADQAPSDKVVVMSKSAELNDMNMKIAELGVIQRFQRYTETIKSAELKSMESSFNKMANDATFVVSTGESIADMAKLASRNVADMGLSSSRVMEAYDEIHQHLVSTGHKVNTDFTKISSMRINRNSEILKPSTEFALSIEKVAALNEMLSNIKTVIGIYTNAIK